MTTLNEIVFDIMELAKGSQISDDTELDERHVIYLVNQQRALWLRNEYNKPGRSIDHNVIQDLGCVKLIEADPAECCEITTPCIVLRSEKKIPNTLELHSKTAITRVGGVNKTGVPYSFVPYAQAIYSGNGKYSGDFVYAYLLNNYMYIKTTDSIAQGLDYINIRGVFENPSEAADFSDCDNKPCYTDDSKYPVNAWVVPYIKGKVLEQLGISMQIPKDSANDAQEIIQKQ